MRHPAAGGGVSPGAHHRFLADQLGKGLRPVFAGQHAIRGRGVGHAKGAEAVE